MSKQLVKVGDLIKGWCTDEEDQVGIVIEVINSDYQVPPVCKILWPSGGIQKEWTDDVEVISETERST